MHCPKPFFHTIESVKVLPSLSKVSVRVYIYLFSVRLHSNWLTPKHKPTLVFRASLPFYFSSLICSFAALLFLLLSYGGCVCLLSRDLYFLIIGLIS
ncbi:hypothetical protein RJT34_26481 [Clitoria ternatea]|uniref:Uncharacterized protein n=1 Tax=Clitoria ternatea TaxID=43366 RepID=A0AAN9FBH7_CLITE